MSRGPGVVLLQVGLLLALGVIAGCSRPLEVGPGAACTDARDCDLGQICTAGVCAAEGVTSCLTDLDCSADGSSLCNAGICVANSGPNPSTGGCATTSECAIDSFCNTATGLCSPLLENWCRVDDQCRVGSPVCSNRDTGPGSPGRCLQCLTNTDCEGGATCTVNGVCATETACPTNATAIGDGTCRCNIGFVDNGSGGCDRASSSSEGEGEGEGEGESPVDPVDPVEPTGPVDETFGGACTYSFECWIASDNDYTGCNEDGVCVCDEFSLWLDCYEYDVEACACVDDGGTSPAGCGDLDFQGECDGETLRWCQDGEVLEYDCRDDDAFCEFVDPNHGYDCMR